MKKNVTSGYILPSVAEVLLKFLSGTLHLTTSYERTRSVRHQVAYNLQKLYNQHNKQHSICNKNSNHEFKALKQIRYKLEEASNIIDQSDKGNSMIVMYADEYNSKVQTFISHNNFTPSKLDLTKKLQRATRSVVNECNLILPKDK